MASVLSSFFARDPKSQFAYDIPSQAEVSLDGVKIGNSFKKAEPDELATIFWASSNDAATLRVQTQKLKTMRHPNILTYQDSIEVDNNFYLVTEKCQPLSIYLETTGLRGNQKEFVVSWGLFQVMNCLKFLHEANLSHENIREAVYVTAGGDWKIGALHKVTAFSSAQCDLNQLAILMWETFNGFNPSMSKPAAPGKLPSRLTDLYKKIATPSAARLSVADILRECRMAGGFFKNKFVDTLLFLEEFQLKEAAEKQSFFMHLRESLDIFPDDIAKYKILPKLIQTYEYGDAGPNILIPMFKLGKLLEEAEYQRRIVPCLVKLFGSSDRTTRVKLLERIDEFASHLTPAIINEKIFTNLVSGFLDTSPAVRESTVKAMVTLAEKLNFHNLNVELMKYLARLQGGDEHGGIRTNTTICLGKIGCFLDPSKRQTILLSAFTRGMKDPFPPARMSAVLALSATQQFYSLIEIANKILPALSPLTCDPEKQVRDQSFKAIQGFLEKLEKASENPELIPELEAQVKAGGRSLLDSDKVPQWASWALKSLSGKFYKGTPPPAVATTGVDGSVTAAESESNAGASAIGSDNNSSGGRAFSKASRSSVCPATDNDGWGDLDDGDEDGLDDEWADAPESKLKEGDDDDWSSGWESTTAVLPEPKVPTKPVAAASKPALKKPLGGGLKLASSTKQRPSPVDPVDAMLGSASSLSLSMSSSSRLPAKKMSAGSSIVSEKSATGGWDDFDDFSTGTTGAATTTASGRGGSGAGGWDDDGWGDDAAIPATQPTASISMPKPSSLNQDKEARRAEAAARQEARRKELAEKKAARGAMKLNPVKTAEKKMDDFADW